MSKNQIRLRYSGFIVFSTQLLGVITGLIYTILLTRNMTKSEYGIWSNIFDYTIYFLLFSNILPFWVTRFTARGKEGTVKTSAFTQLSIGIISSIIYLPIIYLISNSIGTSAYLLIYFLAALNILTTYMVTVFESVLQATKPQAVGYGFIIQEIVKVVVALILILGFKQIFLGAILGLVLGPVLQVLYYVFLLSDFFKEKPNWAYAKEWFKGSPAMIYSAIGSTLFSFIFILLFLYGGSVARAYYQTALSFTTVVGYSSSLAFAVYPKLLAKSCSDEQVGLSFRTVLMLAIPLATITMIMSVSFLSILNGAYGVAWPVLIALTIDTLVLVIYNFYTSCLFGVETFDAEGQISMRKLVRSKIFKVFSVPYIQAAIALPLTYFVLTQFPVGGSVGVTVEVVAILIGVHISSFIGVYAYMKRSIRIFIAWKSIGKYVLAALPMGVVLWLLPTTSTLLSTIAKAIGGFAFYAALLVAIDSEARKLVNLIWLELRVSWQQLIGKNDKINVETS